jgi:integrase
VVPIKKGYCRMCWMQASLEAKGQVSVLQPFLERIRHHQLRFAAMQRPRQPGVRVGKQGRRVLKLQPNPPETRRAVAWTQLRMADVRRDYSGFERRRDADYANPALISARRAATLIAEAHGWTLGVQADVDRALVILLSGHADGDTIRFSELFPALRRHNLSAERTIEVLQREDLFDDDRTSSFESWLERKLAGLAAGIRRDVEHWVRTLRDGGRRSRPRTLETVWGYLNEIQPILVEWSSRYDHLREVTRNDILGAVELLHGSKRRHTVSVLRSLFRHCKKRGSIFADPAARIPVGQQTNGVILPLQADEVQRSLRAAAKPVNRLVLALAAVHAARPKAILQMHLDDIDLGNRRLVVAGRVRPLDDLTRQVLLEWLDYRRTRWPNTANLHLIINQQTAAETGPVSKVWATEAFRGLTATLERLRVDRQLEEALTRGPDPLHLASVFGLDEKTAIRYANAARQLLESSAETQAGVGDANGHVEAMLTAAASVHREPKAAPPALMAPAP